MELERQDIMDYLRIVSLLEWNITELNEDINDIEDERQQLFIKRNYERQQFNPAFFYIGKLFKSLLIAVTIGIAFYFVSSMVVYSSVPTEDGSLLSYINFILIIVSTLALTTFLLLSSQERKLFSQYVKEIREDYNNFLNFEKQEQQRLQEAPARDADLEHMINELANLETEARYNLNQAYEMDILYPTYRNLEAVAAMYGYFKAGSADTLKEALNKYDEDLKHNQIMRQFDRLNKTTGRIYDEMIQQTQLAEQNNQLAIQQLSYANVMANHTQQIARNTTITALNTSLLLLIERRRELDRIY